MTDDLETTTSESAPEGGSSRRSGGSSGFGKSLTFSVGRGIALIAVAIILGVVLLKVVDDGSATNTGKNASATSTTAKTTTTTAAAATTTNPTGTTGALTPPNQLTVVVLNASGITGTAKSVSDKLGAAPLSYKTSGTGNAPNQTGNTVYYTGNLSAEADAMATAVKASTQGVTGLSQDVKTAPMPNPLPKDWPSDASKAQLVVVIGQK